MKITFSPYPNDIPLLEQAVKDKLFVSVAVLVREIVGNWAADIRHARRVGKHVSLPAHHYTSRNADDYSEVE